TSRQSSVSRASKALESGKSIGIFPEGTTNRHPTKLLKGYTGAAQLSLKTGIPVVTAGLTFPSEKGYKKIPEGVPFSVEFSQAIHPPRLSHDIGLKDIRQHHASIMQRLASLSQKTWTA
ncbi:MAG: 1-acyl-sn-glycerol-3-phosphate acyltransferase, partial [Verrucomicrobiota bacterium]|nr:1-acyl-sn-glycerol-3-phosphate acyltransferase [Verrucomicrobiota bacterium]